MGIWHSDRNEVGNLLVDHFKHLYTSSQPTLTPQLSSLFSPMVCTGNNFSLCKIPDVLEILSAVKQLGPAKAPGPDGITAAFYQRYWTTVGSLVIGMVQKFFQSGYLLKQMNHTFVALIPKVNNPTKVEQFRPIALCNVCYKVISKILANRLKAIFPTLISPTQSAFVPGRLIQDNSIIATEVMHSVKKKSGRKGIMALKMDMTRAYD